MVNISAEVEYVTINILDKTTARDVIDCILDKYRFEGKDDKLFYLTLQLTDTNPFQEGLTKKTLILDARTKVMEYLNCEKYFDTKFYLRMKPGTSTVIYISVLLENVDFVNLMLRKRFRVILYLIHTLMYKPDDSPWPVLDTIK